jgi:hypothetical protein
LQDARQSACAEDDEQSLLQPSQQRWLQSVAQSNGSGIGVHDAVQLLSQLDTHSASGGAVHFEAHCRSSFAAQHCLKLVAWQRAAHSLCLATAQLALALTSRSPQAELPANAGRGAMPTIAKPNAKRANVRSRLIGFSKASGWPADRARQERRT